MNQNEQKNQGAFVLFSGAQQQLQQVPVLQLLFLLQQQAYLPVRHASCLQPVKLLARSLERSCIVLSLRLRQRSQQIMTARTRSKIRANILVQL